MAGLGLTHVGTLAVAALEGRHHKGLHRPQDTPSRHLSVWFLSVVLYGLFYTYLNTLYVYEMLSSQGDHSLQKLCNIQCKANNFY